MPHCKGIVKGKIGFIKGTRTEVNDNCLMLCHEVKGHISRQNQKLKKLMMT